jgi:hypothetical protein
MMASWGAAVLRPEVKKKRRQDAGATTGKSEKGLEAFPLFGDFTKTRCRSYRIA